MIDSYLARTREALDAVRESAFALLEATEVRRLNINRPGDSVVIMTAAEYGWHTGDHDSAHLQIDLIKKVEVLNRRIEPLFVSTTHQVKQEQDECFELLRRWANRDGTFDSSIPASIGEARQLVESHLATVGSHLDLLARDQDSTVLLVPDTNALIRNPDLASYRRVSDSETFTLVMIPAVLSELDKLKDRGHPDVKKKAQAVVKRLKGLRDKGSLSAGVRVTKKVTLRTVAVEPKADKVLGWLDPAVIDDRILASAIQLSIENPACRVQVVTSDLNLQNKADAAGVGYSESPPTDAELSALVTVSIERRGDRERYWMLVVRNEGPKRASDVVCSVSSSKTEKGIRIGSGSWEPVSMKRGESKERQLTLFSSGPAYVTLSWTDEVGVKTDRLSFLLDKATETAKLQS